MLTIYFIIGTIWSAIVIYSTLTGKLLSKEEKAALSLIKEALETKKKKIFFIVFTAIIEFLVWPLSIICRWIAYPLVKKHYCIPQD